MKINTSQPTESRKFLSLAFNLKIHKHVCLPNRQGISLNTNHADQNSKFWPQTKPPRPYVVLLTAVDRKPLLTLETDNLAYWNQIEKEQARDKLAHTSLVPKTLHVDIQIAKRNSNGYWLSATRKIEIISSKNQISWLWSSNTHPTS